MASPAETGSGRQPAVSLAVQENQLVIVGAAGREGAEDETREGSVARAASSVLVCPVSKPPSTYPPRPTHAKLYGYNPFFAPCDDSLLLHNLEPTAAAQTDTLRIPGEIGDATAQHDWGGGLIKIRAYPPRPHPTTPSDHPLKAAPL